MASARRLSSALSWRSTESSEGYFDWTTMPGGLSMNTKPSDGVGCSAPSRIRTSFVVESQRQLRGCAVQPHRAHDAAARVASIRRIRTLGPEQIASEARKHVISRCRAWGPIRTGCTDLTRLPWAPWILEGFQKCPVHEKKIQTNPHMHDPSNREVTAHRRRAAYWMREAPCVLGDAHRLFRCYLLMVVVGLDFTLNADHARFREGLYSGHLALRPRQAMRSCAPNAVCRFDALRCRVRARRRLLLCKGAHVAGRAASPLHGVRAGWTAE